ncbi:MAG TPA: shikimate dehydrogenase [Anaerolineae bacterium]|nr:shikimate dehydrogenase [Anaerolineae bacterium]
MANDYQPAAQRTMYFIGVTTGKSSIMKVFPAWAEVLGLNAVIKGFDFPPNDRPENYRKVVNFIKHDPLSLGALVTTHKLNLFKAARDLFDGVGPYAQIIDEVSSISKRGHELWGHAKDPITSGLSLEAIVEDGYWRRGGAHLLLLGAGGSSLALTLYLHHKQGDGGDVPAKIVVTNRSETRLAEMKAVHRQIGLKIPVEYHLAPTAAHNDACVSALPPGSLVVNATGLGKDAPGSPLTDEVVFPENGLVWEFNYRGDLIFLKQASAQKTAKNLTIEDGWLYFIHGWTRVIAEVFHLDIPTRGPKFDQLSQIAASITSGGR